MCHALSYVLFYLHQAIFSDFLLGLNNSDSALRSQLKCYFHRTFALSLQVWGTHTSHCTLAHSTCFITAHLLICFPTWLYALWGQRDTSCLLSYHWMRGQVRGILKWQECSEPSPHKFSFKHRIRLRKQSMGNATTDVKQKWPDTSLLLHLSRDVLWWYFHPFLILLSFEDFLSRPIMAPFDCSAMVICWLSCLSRRGNWNTNDKLVSQAPL